MDKKTVLLADDVDLFLELEKTFLRREGIELLVARNGRQALEMIRTFRPDLAFIDFYMPEMNGDEICRIVKDDPDLKSTPIIIVTQEGRDEDLDRCRRAGCDDILLKPLNRHLFVQSATKFLSVADRIDPRVTASLQIFYGPDPQRLLVDYSVNMSSGGLFIATSRIFPLETPLTLKFSIPRREEVVRCHGRVAWVNLPEKMIKPHLPPGMGIQFLDLKLEDLDVVRDYIKAQSLSSGG